MNIARRPKIVLLGMMSKMPVAGVIWQTIHYLIGFQRLGCEVVYVEAHGCTPRCFIMEAGDDGFAKAAAFIDGVMRRFDLADRWCYHPLYGDDRYFGMSAAQLREHYATADFIINLHGGTEPLPEHYQHARLVYLETDPVELQIELHEKRARTLEFLQPHCAFFTFGENFGHPDCKLPISESFIFKPTRQPVLMDLWENQAAIPEPKLFTTIGNWRQVHRQVHFGGETYYWSKHFEFLKFVDLPALTTQRFELALSSYDEEDLRFLAEKNWAVRDGLKLSQDANEYRRYIADSRGEYTVAKDQNVRFRTGWFSDRSATYLAAGRPVITQETGFSNVLPTGRGLFGFSTMDDLLSAIDRINSNYGESCRNAAEIAREYFNYDVVLGGLLNELGIRTHVPRPTPQSPFPESLTLAPVSRRPLKLREATQHTVKAKALPRTTTVANPGTSIAIVTYNNLTVTRLCLESLLAHTDDCEVIVVDNASTDGTPAYLRELASLNPRLRIILNPTNAGFARANNQALATARGEFFVLLNNDTIVAPGWLPRLLAHLRQEGIGAVGPVTNRIGNEAELELGIVTYGDFLRIAADRAEVHAGESFEIRTLTMFCLALRRETFEQVGPLDEGFGIGMLEDDDYSMRLHHAGLRLRCAEDVLVYHHSQASFGDLVATGRYNALLEQNKARFKTKWGIPWQPYERRKSDSHENVLAHVRECVCQHVPSAAKVLVVTKGEEEMLRLGDQRQATHFPQDDRGHFAGWYPADSAGAIGHLEIQRGRGAKFIVFPKPAMWWLEFYRDFREHLEKRYAVVHRDSDCVIVSLQFAKP